MGMGLPTEATVSWQFFTPFKDGQSGALGVQRWIKPMGCSLIWIMMLSAGGGGGGGLTGLTSTARGGGGGGGSGNIVTYTVPAFAIPDVLYLKPGLGGTPGNASGAGGAGQTSFIYLDQAKTAVLFQGSVGQGGAAGAASGAAAGGFAGAATTVGFLSLTAGIFNSVGGINGGTGGNGATGSSPFSSQSTSQFLSPTSGGGGGGGITSANSPTGGGVSISQLNPSGNWPPAGVTSGGPADGGHSFSAGMHLDFASFTRYSFQTSGGSGGAAINGVAGIGGDAGYGGGGGGGGGGITGGKGGRGGDSIILIGAY